jgi:hypothetical protein
VDRALTRPRTEKQRQSTEARENSYEGLPDLVDVCGHKSPDQLEEEKEAYSEDAMVDVQELIATRGEWVYELYAVLVHSGSALGGHYYAYIKNLDTGIQRKKAFICLRMRLPPERLRRGRGLV